MGKPSEKARTLRHPGVRASYPLFEAKEGEFVRGIPLTVRDRVKKKWRLQTNPSLKAESRITNLGGGEGGPWYLNIRL